MTKNSGQKPAWLYNFVAWSCAIGIVVVLVLLMGIIIPPATPSASSALDPNAEITKKELVFRFLPRTEHEFARIAYGKGQFNSEGNDNHKGGVFVLGDVDVVHFAWEAHLDGDGNIWFFLDRKVPQSILGHVHHKFFVRNESWWAVNNGPHHSATEIFVPNGDLVNHMQEKVSLREIIQKPLNELRDFGLWMEATKYFPLPPSGTKTAASLPAGPP